MNFYDMNSKKMIIKARLKTLGYIELSVKGRCMEPLLYKDEIVKVVAVDKVNIGDICLISVPDGELCLHRIVKEERGFYLTKGDCSGIYEKITRDNIVGKLLQVRMLIRKKVSEDSDIEKSSTNLGSVSKWVDGADNAIKNRAIAILSLGQICRSKEEQNAELKGIFFSNKAKRIKRKFLMWLVRTINKFERIRMERDIW